MSADTLIKISPIIGGTILIVVCLIAILRNPAVSNTFAVLLAFGALLFVIPALSIFNFEGLGIKFSGQAATTEQVTQQAAGIKAQLEDIKTAIGDLGKRIAPSAPAAAAPSVYRGVAGGCPEAGSSFFSTTRGAPWLAKFSTIAFTRNLSCSWW